MQLMRHYATSGKNQRIFPDLPLILFFLLAVYWFVFIC
jgi:hypothetical protein